MTLDTNLNNDQLVLVYNALVAQREEYMRLAKDFFHSDRMGAYYGHRKIVDELDVIIETVKGMIEWGEEEDDDRWWHYE